MSRLVLAGAVVLLSLAPFVSGQNVAPISDPLVAGFTTPPDSAKSWAYWWWLNGNVTEESITKDLEGMKQQGIGGAVLFDADGASQDGNDKVPAGPTFASPEWRELYKHTLREADRLGLSISLNIQSGWNLGGPTITPEHAAKHAVWTETVVSGPKPKAKITLPTPKKVNGFYQDVALIAFRVSQTKTDTAPVTIAASSSQKDFPPTLACDGRTESFWVSGGNDPKNPVSASSPVWLAMTFEKPVAADTIALTGRPGYSPKNGVLEVLQEDGKTWKKVCDFACPADKEMRLKFDRVTSRGFRLTFTSSFDPQFPASPRNVQVAELSLLDGAKTVSGAQQAKTPLKDYPIKIADREASWSAPDCLPYVLDEPEIPGEPVLALSDIRRIDAKISADNQIIWDVPDGEWQILRFGYTQSGSHVSTSSGKWQGFTIDYLSKDALAIYWQEIVKPLIDDAGPLAGKVLRYIHTDSWEAGGMNWTAGFDDEFRRRRLYDLTPYLPVVAGYIVESRERSNRFLNDFRRTIADCIRDNHYGQMKELAARSDIGIHPESGGPHAGPMDSLQFLGLNDLPMSEFWSWSPRHRVGDINRFFLKQPATAAHTYGRRIIPAEGFTNIGMHWQESFSDNLKPSFDQALCEGMNLLVWHAFTSSPAEMGMPGQEYFAGTHFNPNDFVFQKSEDFLRYINRSQFLLQQGLFVADALEFYGENVPNFTQMKWVNTAQSLPGYDYDVATEEVMLERVSVRDGMIVLPDGLSYRVLVLPPRTSISPAVLRKIASWVVNDGLTVIGPKPHRATGLSADAQIDSEVQSLSEQLWGNETTERGVRNVGKGRVIWGQTAREVLVQDGVPQDFERVSGTNEKPRIDSIHRIVYTNQLNDVQLKPFAEWSPKAVGTAPADLESGVAAHVYFVANLSANPDQAVCAFRVTGQQPELWDPLTGTRRKATAFTQEGETTQIPLDFAPYGSFFVVFREAIPKNQNGVSTTNKPAIKHVSTLDGSWRVNFDETWGGPASVDMPKLIPWNTHTDERIKYYSGPATYHYTFDFPKESQRSRVLLRLGNVAEMAEVRLNGETLGTVWARPFELDVTSAIKPQGNRLEITVVNHWANRVIGDAKLPAAERRTKTNIKRLMPDTPLVESGLTGPVELWVEE
ncbi:MAG: glycosyl hydrolase [Thermoguttaceae bacterium]